MNLKHENKFRKKKERKYQQMHTKSKVRIVELEIQLKKAMEEQAMVYKDLSVAKMINNDHEARRNRMEE